MDAKIQTGLKSDFPLRNDRSIWLLAATIISSYALVSSANAATISESALAPSGNILASQLTVLGPGTGDPGRNYADNGGPVGQTFSLGSASTINSFSVLGRGDSSAAWNGGANPWDGSQVWGVLIGSVAGDGSVTPIANETATGFTAGGAINIADYLTFNLTTPINVGSGNYVFSIYLSGATPATDGGWFGLAHADTDAYAGGTAVNYNSSIANPGDNSSPRRQFPASGFAAPVPGGYDYVFAVQGTTVPEPTALAMIGLGGFGLIAAHRRRRA